MKPDIIKNAIRCKRCGEIIESKHTHDFVTCHCGAVSVDGGHTYLKRTGNFDDWDDLSIVEHYPDVIDADSAYYRVFRYGDYYTVCFLDLSRKEQEEIMAKMDKVQLMRLCEIMADYVRGWATPDKR